MCLWVLFLPVSTHAAEMPPTEPGSSVLFFPGIKGSNLYTADAQKAWVAFGDHDIKNLMFTTEGTSIHAGIYTHPWDILLFALGIADIYGSFDSFMHSLSAARHIYEWMPMAYDWRLRLNDILQGVYTDETYTVTYDTPGGAPFIEETVIRMSDESPTKKVSLIAHSNGGLVVKQLLAHLGDRAPQYIDKVIFVGVPQAGAPQALAALLYGYKEGLPWWFPGLVATHTARTFAENAPMAYHLLPSPSAIAHPDAVPLVSFDGNHTHQTEKAAYGRRIDSWDAMEAFATAAHSERTKPPASRIDLPNILNTALLAYGRATHDALAAWTPPEGITLHQIAGTGRETMLGIRYYERCTPLFCVPLMRPVFRTDGDGVVPAHSALSLAVSANVHHHPISLRTGGGGLFASKSHGTMLADAAIQNRIRTILLDEPMPQTMGIQQHVPAPMRHLYLHGRMTLTLYTREGYSVDPRDTPNLERLLPGVVFGELGSMTHLISPYDTEFEIVLEDFLTDTLTLEVETVVADAPQAQAAIVALPVTDTTRLTLNFSAVPPIEPGETSHEETDDASAVARPHVHLQIDHDGNRIVDEEIHVPLTPPEDGAPGESGTEDVPQDEQQTPRDDDVPDDVLPTDDIDTPDPAEPKHTEHAREKRRTNGSTAHLTLLRQYLALLHVFFALLQKFHVPSLTDVVSAME